MPQRTAALAYISLSVPGKLQLDKSWRVIASAAPWRRVQTTLSDSLSPLKLPFHTLVSSEPVQDAGPDGPAAACSPSGSCWQQGLLGPLPLPSFQSLNMGSESVLAFRLNAKAQEPIWHLRRTVHCLKNTTHMPHAHTATKLNQRTAVV